MTPPETTSFLNILLAGQQAPPEMLDDLISIQVEQSLNQPAMFRIRLYDPGNRWSDADAVCPKTEIEIVSHCGSENKSLVVGQISALDAEFTSRMPVLTIQGYDHSYKLYRNRSSRTFIQTTDSEMVEKIARESGLVPDVDNTLEIYEQVTQCNQTNIVFLRERARRIGYRIYVSGKELCFKKPDQGDGEKALTLKLGESLSAFYPRLSAAEQVNKVVVRAWDPNTKQPIIGKAAESKNISGAGDVENGGEQAANIWGEAVCVVVDSHANSQTDADDQAQALLDKISGGYIVARGNCAGHPDLQAGLPVVINGAGKRFSGSYLITACTHSYSSTGGYQVGFTTGEPETAGILPLMSNAEKSREQHINPAIGVVTNNHDPKNLGRVKVRFPWLSDEVESDWARLAVPGGGANRGQLFLPEIGDEVIMAFGHGNIDQPYVLGGVWNGQDAPPETNANLVDGSGNVIQRLIKSRTGHTIIMNDGEDNPGITITDKTGKNCIAFDTNNNAVKITAANKVELQGQYIDIKGDVEVKINGKAIYLN